jgi:hypothetical protein
MAQNGGCSEAKNQLAPAGVAAPKIMSGTVVLARGASKERGVSEALSDTGWSVVPLVTYVYCRYRNYLSEYS